MSEQDGRDAEAPARQLEAALEEVGLPGFSGTILQALDRVGLGVFVPSEAVASPEGVARPVLPMPQVEVERVGLRGAKGRYLVGCKLPGGMLVWVESYAKIVGSSPAHSTQPTFVAGLVTLSPDVQTEARS